MSDKNGFRNKKNKNEDMYNRATEASWGGFQYRWNYDEYQRSLENKKRKANNPGMITFTVTFATVFLMCLLTVAGVFSWNYLNSGNNIAIGDSSGNSDSIFPMQSSDNISGVYVSQSGTSRQESLTVAQISEKGKPWVVGVVSDRGMEYEKTVGTGIIVTDDGYIATNCHVVDGGVYFSVITDENVQYDAQLVGKDTVSDLAVLKIKAHLLDAAEIGNSDELVSGDTVVAIGTPAGIVLSGSVTSGIVSAIYEDLPIFNTDEGLSKTMNVIQTTASINYGNSGGPLLNDKGQVVGINTIKLSDEYEGMSFAIPINGAIPIIEALIEEGRIIDRPSDPLDYGKATMAITGEDITEMTSKLYRLPRGVMVKLLQPDSNASAAGLQIGDIIVSVDGEYIYSTVELDNIIQEFAPGDMISVYVYRNGDYFDYQFALNEE